MNERDIEEFRELSDKLIQFLAEKGHPHMSVIVTPIGAELVEGVVGNHNESFIKD